MKQSLVVAGAITNREEQWLNQVAEKGLESGVIVEIGSFKGKSTIALAVGSKSAGREKIYAIDPHLGSKVIGKKFSGPTYKTFLTNLRAAKVRDWVVPIRKFSFEAIKTWRKPIRLLFIDGNHSYAAVRRDILDWEPWVVPGGVIACHDTLNPAEGVSRAISKYLLDTQKLVDVGVIDSIFYGIKDGKKQWKDGVIKFGIRLVPKLLRMRLPGMKQYVVKRWIKRWLTFLTQLKL